MDAQIIDPADVRKLVKVWRSQARTIEQAGECKGCPLGGVPYALRQCASEAEALLTLGEVPGK